jgi:hypothetical protein
MELVLSKKFKNSLVIAGLCLSPVSVSAVGKKINYKTNFGHCPSRTAGQLAMRLIKKFEEKKSLREVKKDILGSDLISTYFISDYKINFDPLRNALKFNFKCPRPLMKVQVYKENGLDSYEAILVENGQLFDPTYEVLLRSDRKLKKDLPFLALPVGTVKDRVEENITDLVKRMGPRFREKVSEVILDDKGEATVILSLKGNPSSVFLGKDEWVDKVDKLKRIISAMEKRRKYPAIINITNAKKVVVKFNTNI